jgi:hypothetical protein
MDPRTGDIYTDRDAEKLRADERDRLLPISGDLARVMRNGNRAQRRKIARMARRTGRGYTK